MMFTKEELIFLMSMIEIAMDNSGQSDQGHDLIAKIKSRLS